VISILFEYKEEERGKEEEGKRKSGKRGVILILSILILRRNVL